MTWLACSRDEVKKIAGLDAGNDQEITVTPAGGETLGTRTKRSSQRVLPEKCTWRPRSFTAVVGAETSACTGTCTFSLHCVS